MKSSAENRLWNLLWCNYVSPKKIPSKK